MASRARSRRRFKSSTSRLTMQSYTIKPAATPVLSAALWLRRPLGRKASRTLPSSLPRRAPNWRETEEARDRCFRAFEAEYVRVVLMPEPELQGTGISTTNPAVGVQFPAT
jgi:hypothetical protein